MKILIDTREQKPWSFSSEIETERRKLDTGDYSVEGYETRVCIERKSLNDFVNSLTRRNSNFWSELSRIRQDGMLACVVVEGSMYDITMGRYTSKTGPESVIGLAASIHIKFGIPVVLASDRMGAITYATTFLQQAIKAL